MSTTTTQATTSFEPIAASTVVADMSMSLDGFVAEPDDRVDRVFAWYAKPQPPRQPDADRDSSGPGVIVYGRRTFDVAQGWGGTHSMGVPVIVVTHDVPDGWPRPDSSVEFNTGGIESAIKQAKTIAEGKDVALEAVRASPSNAWTTDSWIESTSASCRYCSEAELACSRISPPPPSSSRDQR